MTCLNFTAENCRKSLQNKMVTLLLKDIWHDRLRVILTIIALVVVVFAFFILNAFAQAMSDYYQVQSGSRNLIILQADSIDPTDSTLDPAVLQAVQNMPSDLVGYVSPVIFRHMRVDERVVILRASPMEFWENIFQLELLQGRWPQPFGEVAVGQGTAQANNWQIGSIVNIYNRDFRISAIVTSPGSAYASIWMPAEQAEGLFGAEHGYQGMYVQAAPEADLEGLRGQLEQNPLISDKYAVFYEDAYASLYNQLLKDIDSLMSITSSLALLAVCLGTYTSTNLDLAERAREIGILRAVGFSHDDILKTLSIRAVVQSWLAFMAGLACAYAYIAYRHTHSQLFVLGVHFNFRITWQLIGQGFLLTSVFAAAGAWLSCRHLLGSHVHMLLRNKSS